MVRYKPMGSRVFVEPIITTVSLEERARKAGLELVLEQENIPKPTQGRVLALGPDPLLHEQIKIGDIVFFHAYSGSDVTLEGVTYRQLDITEVTGVMFSEEATAKSVEPVTPQAG